EADRKKDEALAEEKNFKQAWLAAEEEWEKIVQEYRDERSGQSVSQEQGNEYLKERDRAVNRRWEKLLKKYQNTELERSAVEQEEISEAIMALESQLEQAYRDSLITYGNQEMLALAHYREVAFKRALENARNHPAEMAEVWEEIGIQKKATAAQLEINKQAAEVFKKEAKRLERIEKIWKGILQKEQEEAKQTREQAAQEYYRGNHTDWNTLSEQERTRYNNESKKANQEYDDKRDEQKKLVDEAQAEKLKIEAEIKRVEGKSWLSITEAKRKEKLTRFYRQLEELENTIKKTSEQLNEQEELLRTGRKSRQKENYYQALTQAQGAQGKVRGQRNNPYWQHAAQCYEKASRYWEQSTNNNSRETEQQENEKIAASYGRAAEAYQKAAEEHADLLKTHNKGKESLIKLYNEEGKLYEQLAKQQEKEGINTDTYDLQENLHQLEKKIDRYLGTRGAQIEEIQENIPLLQKRFEELNKEAATFRQQAQETLASKKEALAVNLRELIDSCKKALEDLLQEVPESSERATAVIESIQFQKTKDQQLQKTIEQTLQLEAKIVPLEQRAASFSVEITAAQTRGELFLSKAQQSLLIQLNKELESARKVQQLILKEEIHPTAFQTCMSMLQQLEVQDHYLQQIAPQLRQLDQSKTVLNTRNEALKNSIKGSQNQGDTFLAQGQEKLLSNATKLFLEIDPVAEQLLKKNDKASAQVNSIVLRSAQFQEQDQAFQKNTLCLKELGQKQNSFQKRSEVLSREITASQSRGETLLVEGQQQLHKTIGQALSAIERTSNQILAGANNSAEEAAVLLGKLKQLEERDQALQKNAPILLALEQKRNLFQIRLKNLSAEITTSRNQGKVYLNEGQQTLMSEITQVLSKIDQSAKQLLASANEAPEAPAAAKALLTQLEQLVKRDQQLQQNAPVLEKLDEKKNFFQRRIETLSRELQSYQNHQKLLLVQKQLLLEINQALAQIDQNAKQLLSGTLSGTTAASSATEQIQALFNQLDLLDQRDQRLQQHLVQLKNLEQAYYPLKNRGKALENEIITSQIRGEIMLAQAQQTLLEEMNKTLQQSSEAAKQLLTEDQGTSEEIAKASEITFQRIKELIPQLDRLRLRDERLQENALALRDLEQKKKLLQERIETLKTEMTTLGKTGEPLLAQQQQALVEAFQRVFDKISEIGGQLMIGADQSLEQAKALFKEIDQLQTRAQQLKENIFKIQELQQKKN
ncbi:MAG TPA: hypothetical protein VJK54_06025, partial [Chthoniobacterales bacterium]|nr:hypothetical protein [Chthoniobacterales bacterium]